MTAIRKVTLIEPKPAGYHIYSHVTLPRLGLPLLGAILKKRGVDVKVYCQSFHDIDWQDVLASDLVGISTTTSTAPEGYKIAEKVKEAEIPIVVGGPHVTFLPDEALAHADYCLRGEAEASILLLLDSMEASSGFEDVPGLSYRIDGENIHNPMRQGFCDVNALPFPDLSLIAGYEKMRVTPMETMRGCPFDCTFCSVTQMFGRRLRKRDVDAVVEEMQRIDPKFVFYYDDNFTADKDRAKILIDKLLSKGITPSWSAQTRVDVAKDRELLSLMKRSNCHILYMGFESVNKAALDEFNKNQSVEEMEDAVRILHEHGIMAHGMFVLGSDSDTQDDLRASLQFALRNSIDTVQFLALTPLPGTQYYEKMEREDRLLTHDWRLYDGQHVVFKPRRMSPYQLQKEMFRAMKRFYSVWECTKMLIGPEIIRFAAGLNARLALGHWDSAKRYAINKASRWRYRAIGHILLKRWEAANRDFVENVQKCRIESRS